MALTRTPVRPISTPRLLVNCVSAALYAEYMVWPGLDSHQAIDLLIDRLKKSKNNLEFLMQVSKTAPGIGTATSAASMGASVSKTTDSARKRASVGMFRWCRWMSIVLTTSSMPMIAGFVHGWGNDSGRK